MKTPPVAERRAHTHSLHDDVREDPWFWLRDRDNPAVTAYLEQENAWAEQSMAHTRDLQKQLYDDMLSRIRQTDLSVPYRHGDWEYFSRTEEGLEYPIYCRRPRQSASSASGGANTNHEEVILDVNLLARDLEYFSLGVLSVSPDHRWLAWSQDDDGSEHYTLFVRNLETGEVLDQAVPDTEYGFAWANDSSTMFYTTLDEAHRPYRVYRLRAGEPASKATLVFEESDEAFFVSVYRTISGRFVFIDTENKNTSEVKFVNADSPGDAFQTIAHRRTGIEYQVDHQSERFLITTNDGAPNFRLCEAPVSAPAPENWRTLIEHREDVTLHGAIAFARHIVIFEQTEGLPRITIEEVKTGSRHVIATDEPVYEIYEATNVEYDTDLWRFHYSSLVTPNCVYEYNMQTRERTLLKQTEVLGGFDGANYTSERVWATAEDGTRVPVSLVYRRDLDRTTPAPVLLTAYGSYGSSYSVHFSSSRLCLLDRGIIYAIAHIRGGQEMGRRWYDTGKLDQKANTFSDFIDCSQHLIKSGYTTPDRLAIMGGSAGGLLMGAAVNSAPELFKAVLAMVPFVDVISTLVDTTLPLSRTEWDEWGDPNDPHFYRAMRTWSPYDNVRSASYPAMLVTGGLNDPRVSYWEPAKWVARLRTVNTGSAPLLLKTNMGAGHSGASGRYGQIEETAFEYAFIVDQIT